MFALLRFSSLRFIHRQCNSLLKSQNVTSMLLPSNRGHLLNLLYWNEILILLIRTLISLITSSLFPIPYSIKRPCFEPAVLYSVLYFHLYMVSFRLFGGQLCFSKTKSILVFSAQLSKMGCCVRYCEPKTSLKIQTKCQYPILSATNILMSNSMELSFWSNLLSPLFRALLEWTSEFGEYIGVVMELR